MKCYPVSLVGLDGARCLVIGGGDVAARKVAGLRAAGAWVVVISPVLCEPLEGRVAHGDIEALRRPYRNGDLAGAFLVIAATDDPAVNRQIWEEAQARGVLINTVDDPARCNFFAPAVVRRGGLTLAISTDGHCPALARYLRERLEQQFGPPYGPLVEILGDLRERVRTVLHPGRRNAFWDQLFHSDILALLASGDEAAARRCAEEILNRHACGDV